MNRWSRGIRADLRLEQRNKRGSLYGIGVDLYSQVKRLAVLPAQFTAIRYLAPNHDATRVEADKKCRDLTGFNGTVPDSRPDFLENDPIHFPTADQKREAQDYYRDCLE